MQYQDSIKVDPTRRRIDELDILRGWAIFGMLFVNVFVFEVSDLPPLSYMLQKVWAPPDKVAYLFIDSFFQAKFWSLFSFLFGLGFALQVSRAEKRGVRVVGLYLRRLLGLFVIGSVQYVLWPASILPTYAITGVFLLPFRHVSARTVLVTAFTCLVISFVLEQPDFPDKQDTSQLVHESVQHDAARNERRQETLRIYSEGTFGELLSHNTAQYTKQYATINVFRWVFSGEFPLFLLGLYVGRLRIFEDISNHLSFIRKVWWWGLGLGLLNLIVNAWAMLTPSLPYFAEVGANFVWRVGAPALGFCYASTLLLLAQRDTWKRRLAPLSAVGRMALSNYLLHSLVLQCIFFGLGLYGKLGPATSIPIAGLVFALLVVFSTWWLSRFQFGPAEWLWRSMTYGKVQPLRIHNV